MLLCKVSNPKTALSVKKLIKGQDYFFFSKNEKYLNFCLREHFLLLEQTLMMLMNYCK